MIWIVMELISKDFKIEMLVQLKEEEKDIKEPNQTGMLIQKTGLRQINQLYKMVKKKMSQIPTGLNLILKHQLTKKSFGAMLCMMNKNLEIELFIKKSKSNNV